MKLLRDRGYTVQKVEYWNPFAKQCRDLWAYDIAGISTEGQLILVQTTTASNHSARRRKCLAQETYPMLKAGGHKLEVHSWEAKQNGKRKKWSVRVECL